MPLFLTWIEFHGGAGIRTDNANSLSCKRFPSTTAVRVLPSPFYTPLQVSETRQSAAMVPLFATDDCLTVAAYSPVLTFTPYYAT